MNLNKNQYILYVAVSTGHLSVFHIPHIEFLRELGYKVDVAAKPSPGFCFENFDEFYPHEFSRSPFSFVNIKNFISLVKVLRSKKYAIVHCHTPVASALTRVASIFAKGNPVVIYTAHGFHFYPGGSLATWIVWFSLEWVLARLTDIIVTINKWDLNASINLLKARRARLIPGIGLNVSKFSNKNSFVRNSYRELLGYNNSNIVILYIAEFINRKNHKILISAFSHLHKKLPHIRLLLVGDGPLKNEIQNLCEEKKVSRYVQFLGFRKDVPELTWTADIAVSTSKHEGLPIGVSEAIAAGLPVVASKDRGHSELINHRVNGFIFDQDDELSLIKYLDILVKDSVLREVMSRAGQDYITKFDITHSVEAMKQVYQEAQVIADRRACYSKD